ncbi:hypothetical protein FNU76_04100 [Chitinimonas arctica]|uniref:Type II secretion system protein M n=1 Tax=Chitinimonas arctica TaxID=2594795 RepID=A0A516SBS5_9NEIS|nr:hypothetical protein [Chitinimonas arctica]QDQ25599.1 hypothetical protein FNU76_04100 [Chitinimonas arctica]
MAADRSLDIHALPGRLRIAIEIRLHRQGWIAPCGWLLVLAAALVWLQLPFAERRLADQHTGVPHGGQPTVASAAGTMAPDSNAARLARLYTLLDQAGDRQANLRQVFDIAEAEGWDIAEADYTVSAKDGLVRLRILLPLQGSYPEIRALAEALLRGRPNLSLDDIGFKRDSSQADSLHATLKLSLWSRAGQGLGRGQKP